MAHLCIPGNTYFRSRNRQFPLVKTAPMTLVSGKACVERPGHLMIMDAWTTHATHIPTT
jgi:hypothetical protein